MAVPVAAIMAAKEGSEMLGSAINSAKERSESMEPRAGTKASKTFVVDRLLNLLDPENTMNLNAQEKTAHREAGNRLSKLNNETSKAAVQKTIDFAKRSPGMGGPGM